MCAMAAKMRLIFCLSPVRTCAGDAAPSCRSAQSLLRLERPAAAAAAVMMSAPLGPPLDRGLGSAELTALADPAALADSAASAASWALAAHAAPLSCLTWPRPPASLSAVAGAQLLFAPGLAFPVP